MNAITTGILNPNTHPALVSELAAIGESLRRSTVRVTTRGTGGGGSGVIWSADGLIVTNAHVVRSDRTGVTFWDGRTLPARLLASDTDRDLAALQIDADAGDFPAATPGDARTLRPGDLVLALGNPLGWVGALSLGIVHTVEQAGGHDPPRWIRADVRLAPGNSGGPLADANGHVLGINTMIARGLGVAVPVNSVTHFLRGGGARRALGVVVRPVGLRIGGADRLGLLVLEVGQKSLAAAAGVLPGDVLIGIGTWKIETPGDLALRLTEAVAGEVLRLEMARGGKIIVRNLRIPATGRAKAA